MATKKAIVTGAAGLLGRETVTQLANAGVEVHALVRSGDQAFRDDVEFHAVDLGRPLDAARLPSGVDVVYHLAQAREFRAFPEKALPTFAINVASTAFLLDWAVSAGASNFVYASSGGVYRGGTEQTLTEDAPLQSPETLGYYLAGKLASESLVHSYAGQFATTVLRYFFIYGPGQARGMLIPRLYDRVRNGEPLQIQGSDGMRINPVHAEDAAAATIIAAEIAGRSTINIAGPEVVSLRQIGELFGEVLNTRPVFEAVEGIPTHLVASTLRMATELVAPSITLREAVSELAG